MTDHDADRGSEHAELLADVDAISAGMPNKTVQGILYRAAAALRALEAKASGFLEQLVAAQHDILTMAADRDRLNANHDKLLTEHIKVTDERNEARQERGRLAAEVERLHVQLETALALKNQERERNDWLLKRIVDGQALMPPPRIMVLDQSAEVAALREDAERYRWLRDNRWPQEVWTAVHSRQMDSWNQVIDAARRAGEGQG